MRVNAENCLRTHRSEAPHLAWLLEELIRNMKELKARQAAGDGASALEEFLVLYCIKEPAPPAHYEPGLADLITAEDLAAVAQLKGLLKRMHEAFPEVLTVPPTWANFSGLLFQLAPPSGPELLLKEIPDLQLAPGEGIAREHWTPETGPKLAVERTPGGLQPWVDPELARKLCSFAAIWAEEHSKGLPPRDLETAGWASRVLGLGYKLLKAKRAIGMEGGPRG